MTQKQDHTWAIDISHWWTVDWPQIPDFIQLVLVKATEGDYLTDPCFEQHIEEALGAGKTVGVYHFYRTQIGGRKVPPEAQAEYFLQQTRQYWDDLNLRANDFERGFYLQAVGKYYNPRLGSECEDLFQFHQTLHQSDWLTFDLLYTNVATWQEMKIENPSNFWQGPAWIKDQPFIDGLWLAWWPYRRPRSVPDLEKFVSGSFSPRLPRPFNDYWAWQLSADFVLPGLNNAEGMMGKPADLSYIPYPPEIVDQMLSAYWQEESVVVDVKKMAAAYRAGWRDRTDQLAAYLKQTRDTGVK